MYGRKLIRTLRLTNFLSYGPESVELELQPLNVLIGPNGSGKSNFIEALSLLRAAPRDLPAPVREGGGVGEWLWKGSPTPPQAEIDATVYCPDGVSRMPLRYRLRFAMVGQRFDVVDEAVENERPNNAFDREPFFYYRYQAGNPVLSVVDRVSAEADNGSEVSRTERRLRREDLKPEQSVLSQRKDPDQYPEVTYLGAQFENIRLYREWNMGRFTAPRLPQRPDLPQDFLLEDGSNLGLVLNDLEFRGTMRESVLPALARFNEAIDHVSVRVYGGTVQLFLHEQGLTTPVSATRLSDGTLRYLCLLAVLCHPEPPPLVCIEEPELGLHPDIIPTVAELLKEAAHRTQLIVTTHSDMLVSALSDVPETIVVCERDDAGTHMRRLEPEPLKKWIDEYRLGDAWLSGHFGGVRF